MALRLISAMSLLAMAVSLQAQSVDPQPGPFAESDQRDENSKPPSVQMVRPPKPPDFNRSIYYKNKLEFGLDVGYLPINIPFVFDVFLGDGYTTTSLKYTLVPIFASLRWQMDDVGGWSFLRGNWDLSFTASVTAIPRGPETHYFSYIMGIRRNFVQRNWKIAPYFDGRLGLGDIDAKGPLGVLYAQGQNFTFTVNMGSGVRYNFNPRYSISAGLNWMHISNLYLSQPQFANYGINVYGPMFGIDVRIGKPHHHASE
ncbi:MAG: acyloxyacyl hydrolase [Candidatus Sulfotelmatobacter sp.]